MRARARQFLVFAAVLAYLLAGHGLLPSASMLARWSPLRERFPCEDCACGCTSARECWMNCCCHSAAQRVAWAHRHGVTPPAYAAAAIERDLEASGDCELCAAQGHDDDDRGPGPVMSALGCRGLAGWIMFAAPAPWRAEGERWSKRPEFRGELLPHRVARIPTATIDVPTPPPRAA